MSNLVVGVKEGDKVRVENTDTGDFFFVSVRSTRGSFKHRLYFIGADKDTYKINRVPTPAGEGEGE